MTALIRSLQIGVTIAIFGVLWHIVDGPQAGAILTSAQPIWLIAGLLTLSAQTILSAIRWRITADQLGLHLPMRVAVHEYYLSQMINQVLPGGVVGDASRAVRSRRAQGVIVASQAVIFERLAGQLALFVVMTAAIAVTFFTSAGPVWPSWSVPILMFVIFGGLSLGIVCVLAVYVPSPIREKVKGLAKAMGQALFARRVIVVQITLSFATVLCNLAAFAFCARAVGVDLSPLMVCALVPLILFTMLIPLTVMGWGLREGAAAAFLPLAGATTSESVAASVAFGLTLFAASVPGMIAIWVKQKPTDAVRKTKV